MSIKNQVLDNLFISFSNYYNIQKNTVQDSFIAQAEFHSHNEQYLLVKAAKIADIDSHEYVYFSLCDNLSKNELLDYIQKSWSDGLTKVKPFYGHKNTDITLIIITDKIDNEIIKQIQKTHLYKSYKFSFYGWTNFRLSVVDVSTKKVYYNKFGKNLKQTMYSAINKLDNTIQL